jgi:hypothetical protein
MAFALTMLVPIFHNAFAVSAASVNRSLFGYDLKAIYR